jgi:hypothetical protein
MAARDIEIRHCFTDEGTTLPQEASAICKTRIKCTARAKNLT